MFYHLDASSLNGTSTNSTGRSQCRISITVPTTDENPMGTTQISTFYNSMDFSMKILFVGLTRPFSKFCLVRVSFHIRVLSNRQNTAATIIDHRGYVLPLISASFNHIPLVYDIADFLSNYFLVLL